ncbi:MAG: S8 family serine peptidase [candidate division Zixibacteria bacterium]|nr:S8 family serine peptidase [candidate division Zixibacteria bacterium]MBU1470350.1 S8 family serine peptidase [candidate division Zixibacteria bacterium]
MRKTLVFFALVIGLVLLISAGFAFGSQDFKVKSTTFAPDKSEYAAGEILVKFRADVKVQDINRIHAKHGTSEMYTSPRAGFKRISIPSTATVDQMVELFRGKPEVEYAEPNYIFHAFMTPNDPYYSYQWHMPMINMEQAWDQSTGTGVVVAIVDCGVAYENYGSFAQAPDLAGTSFVPGYDFVNNDTHPNDDNGHGTHVAGTVAQTTNNGVGVTGVAFNCSIMPVKVLDSQGSGYLSDVADGIIWAADNGADVINMSLGASSTTSTLQNAVQYAYGMGVTIVCAAGNAGTPVAQYPAAYTECISVSAVRYDKALAYYSSYGSTIDICAPGGDVTVDQNGDGYVDGVLQQTHDGSNYSSFSYYFYQGTSMASPHVAGVAALLLAKDGSLTPQQVRDAIQGSAEDLGAAGWDQSFGYGLVDANAALQSLTPTPPVANFSGSPTSGTVPLTVNFTDLSTGSVTSWSWTFGDGGTSTAQNPSHQYTSANTYTVSLTVTGPGGSDGETKTNYITVNPCVTPTAGFVGSPTSGDYPLLVNFTDQSSGATSWAWTFGDGGTSTASNPSHTYTSAGTFTVTQTVTNSCGNDQLVRTNYITVTTPPCYAPVAAFVGSPTSGTYPLTVNFTDQSTNAPTSWSWTFGDGGTSTAQNPSHTYTSAGTFTVTLTATNSCGSDGETKTGYITVTEPSTWTVITYDDFESGWGSYTDGGGDCSRYTRGTYAHQGSAAADIQDNSGTSSSFYHTTGYDVSGYSELQIEFWFRASSMESGEDFWVQYYNGSTWQTVATFTSGTDFSNNVFYNAVVSISSSQYSFPTNAKLRFMCDASDNRDDVYIDEIEFRGMGGGTSGFAKNEPLLPEEFSLAQNYPNPFNPVTQISFTLPTTQDIRLEVFNILGQRVEVLADRAFGAGSYTIPWDASKHSSGVYFYRLSSATFNKTMKMVLMK